MPTLWVRFGAFEADLRTGELRKNGVKIKLHHQPFQVLSILLEHPGEVVTREELQRRLWPADTFVDFDNGLNTAVKKLREALNESAESPRYVETLPRRGYRFIARVSNVSTSDAEPAKEVSVLAVAADPPAEREREMANPSSRVHSRSMLWAIASGAVALLVLLVWLNTGDWRHRLWGRATPIQIRAIAVLPLDNLGDPGQEYFADGMTDALITNLAQISSLKVRSRTSVMRYKGTHKPLQVIAKELNVDGIVEGTVMRSGERVRVDAQLIESSTDRHFWAKPYERNLSDVIALQNELAQAITNEIQVKLTPEEQARLLRREPVDPKTYDLYVKGLYFSNKFEKASILRGIDYYQQAIQRDPKYAPAYAGMARAYADNIILSHEDQCLKLRAIAEKALQLDGGLAEAHAALADRLFLCDWDWAGAEKEYQRAITLNPSAPGFHAKYGQLLKALGRQNWVAETKRALELNPVAFASGGAEWYLDSGEYDKFIERQRQRMELNPSFPQPYVFLGRVYTLKGMYAEAIVNLKKAVDLSEREPGSLSALGYTYGFFGKRKEASKILYQLTRSNAGPADVALVYVGLGEKDRAFDVLQKGLADHSIVPTTLRRVEWNSIRSDTRWAELLGRMDLPP
jgi:TolB-like protein/DNA-binding winged helix-turn-helix (wHTH) protein/Tfp pilus assembly protein PilF